MGQSHSNIPALYSQLEDLIDNGFKLRDSANLDAFSRLRTSHPEALFSYKSEYSLGSLIFEPGATGTGVTPTYSSTSGMTAISCTAGTGVSYLQSFQYIPYQAGKSQFIPITGLIGAAVANVTVDTGWFDANDGVFFRQNGTTNLQFVVRSSASGSVVNNAVAQADWNLDTLDGTGASGITLDITTTQIIIFDLQLLFMGRVRVGFDIGGNIVYCHEFTHANSSALPYMRSGTLPIQMLVTSTSSASTKTAYFKCVAVLSEGGDTSYEDLAYNFSTPSVSLTASSGARTHAISLRPLTTFNSRTNRCSIIQPVVEILVTGNNPVYWELCIGQAITSSTWTSVNSTHSSSEYGTGTISGSPVVVIASGFVSASNQLKQQTTRGVVSRYPICLDRAGAVRANGTLSLLLTGLGGTSACYVSMDFKEIR